MSIDFTNKNCILIVDDDGINRELLKNVFSPQFTFEEAENGRECLAQVEANFDKLCAIILDLQMPEMNGLEVLKKLSEQNITEQIPIFLITAYEDDENVTEAYTLGAVDVVPKPIKPIIIQRRVKTVIELFAAREALSEKVTSQEQKLSQSAKAIDSLHKSTIEALATAIEFRDIESGQHVSRIYGMTKYILKFTEFGRGMTPDTIESIARGAIMHDVGKIAISDIILNKPGKLTKEEFEIMKAHTVKGEALLARIANTQFHESYKYAAEIARHHHERWDGRGYPDGLKGDEITLASQVVSIVDVYDALVSVRVYKRAYTPDEAVDMIKNGQCGVFNPKLLECFLAVEPEIRKWYDEQNADSVPENLSEDTELISALNKNTAISLTDDDNNPVLDVMLIMTAVQTTYDMIISVNLTRNSYHMIDYNRFKTHCAPDEGVFDELIEAGTSSIPSSHRKEFHDTFCRSNLLNAYHSGHKSVRLEHPQYTDDGTMHWVATKVLFFEDVHTGEILQITLAQYIDDEYAQRENTRKLLTEALNLTEQASGAK